MYSRLGSVHFSIFMAEYFSRFLQNRYSFSLIQCQHFMLQVVLAKVAIASARLSPMVRMKAPMYSFCSVKTCSTFARIRNFMRLPQVMCADIGLLHGIFVINTIVPAVLCQPHLVDCRMMYHSFYPLHFPFSPEFHTRLTS